MNEDMKRYIKGVLRTTLIIVTIMYIVSALLFYVNSWAGYLFLTILYILFTRNYIVLYLERQKKIYEKYYKEKEIKK